jgi:pSer/pThr/pTyr-binding forkhead associated (FHA) protein
MTLALEIIEGPGAGRLYEVSRPTVIGRSPQADIQIDDAQASRNHARVSPDGRSALLVEDLKSANGTFVNDNEVYGSAVLEAGDELQLGVTVLRARTSREEIRLQGSAVRAVPPGLAVAESPAQYINQQARVADDLPDIRSAPISPELERFRDVKVRARATFAPIAFAVLIAIVLAIYLLTR